MTGPNLTSPLFSSRTRLGFTIPSALALLLGGPAELSGASSSFFRFGAILRRWVLSTGLALADHLPLAHSHLRCHSRPMNAHYVES